jgi:hypothetical protein
MARLWISWARYFCWDKLEQVCARQKFLAQLAILRAEDARAKQDEST